MTKKIAVLLTTVTIISNHISVSGIVRFYQVTSEPLHSRSSRRQSNNTHAIRQFLSIFHTFRTKTFCMKVQSLHTRSPCSNRRGIRVPMSCRACCQYLYYPFCFSSHIRITYCFLHIYHTRRAQDVNAVMFTQNFIYRLGTRLFMLLRHQRKMCSSI